MTTPTTGRPQAVNKNYRRAATPIVLAQLAATIERLTDLQNYLTAHPGDGIGLMGHGVVGALDELREVVALYQNDARSCVETRG